MDEATAREIWADIRSTRFTDFLDDLIDLAVRYAQTRVAYQRANTEERSVIEESRTLCHNAFIVSCDALARAMAKQGENAEWRRRLGTDRKVIGDFACYLHAFLGIAAR